MKQWQTPKLIVLVRGKPEEWVLDGCKQTEPSSGPGNAAPGCYQVLCQGCSDISNT